ncbi:MAG: glycosyltransferase family 4 protein [Candidatus Zambryskibacteria bacterium]|nr:glycosyltransferase family 4 protein [Candidatus Zambryskibacteria bacterium]
MASSTMLTTGNKRILIFSLAYYPVEGGAEIAVKEITNRINDIEFDMITMRFDDNHAEKEKVGNVNLYRIKANKITFPIEAALFARKLHKEKHYDAIWSIMANRAGGAALFFKYTFPEVPFILTLQEGDPIEYMKRRSLYWINPFFRKIFTNADIVQAISLYLSDYASIMGHKGKVEVIPNGVDYKNFQTEIKDSEKMELRNRFGFSTTDTLLITTSRLVEKNAVGDIILALKSLPEHYKLLILGVGPQERDLKALAVDALLESRVKFLGHIPSEDVPKYLHASDIFIRPSIAEGFGNSFIEAMAAGLPVIATPVGGIVDFLRDGETGLFCEVKDPENIARQVTKLAGDPDLRQKLINNGRNLAREKYDWDLVAKEMKARVFDKV